MTDILPQGVSVDLDWYGRGRDWMLRKLLTLGSGFILAGVLAPNQVFDGIVDVAGSATSALEQATLTIGNTNAPFVTADSQGQMNCLANGGAWNGGPGLGSFSLTTPLAGWTGAGPVGFRAAVGLSRRPGFPLIRICRQARPLPTPTPPKATPLRRTLRQKTASYPPPPLIRQRSEA